MRPKGRHVPSLTVRQKQCFQSNSKEIETATTLSSEDREPFPHHFRRCQSAVPFIFKGFVETGNRQRYTRRRGAGPGVRPSSSAASQEGSEGRFSPQRYRGHEDNPAQPSHFSGLCALGVSVVKS